MIYAIIADGAGRLLQILHGPIAADYRAELDRRGVTYALVETDRDAFDLFNSSYLSRGTLHERQPLPATIDKADIAADGHDAAVITGLPLPCIVEIDGEPVEVETGALPLTTDMPGDYEIAVRHWPYLDWTITLKAR